MVYVKKSRKIVGDPEKIWDLISQVKHYPRWMPGVITAEVRFDPGRSDSALGRKQLLKTDIDFGKGETLQEVIAWEPPHKITWHHLSDVVNGKEVSHAKEIKTTLSVTNENGEVTFRMIGSWEPVGISGNLMNRFMKRMVSKNFEKALDNLERLISTPVKRKKPDVKNHQAK
jgi:uncharacterized protein YndB with AHSA1/START domain